MYIHIYLLGMLPLGSSCCVSWIRTFWKSTKWDWLMSSMNLRLLTQLGFVHTVGCKETIAVFRKT